MVDKLESIDYESPVYSSRFKGSLKRVLDTAGIITYEDLKRRSVADLWQLRGMGLASIEAIIRDLQSKGYALRE